MKSQGVLINKEQLRSNYKLTFRRGEKEFFCFLHWSKRVIFNDLKIGIEYNFLWVIGKNKNYNFLNPYSISNAKENKEETPKQLFFNDLVKRLGIRKNKLEKINKKIEQITSEKEASKKDYLNKAKKIIELLFLKHQELGKKGLWLTDNQQKEKSLLEELKTIFYFDYIWQD